MAIILALLLTFEAYWRAASMMRRRAPTVSTPSAWGRVESEERM
jgi:hypothetical protein